ncbi:eukaryotic translation initiation factor 3 subunit G-like isoform X1 [Abrus precatorius]|uniref:Eukaryotic translation initiation factor 3 subunit G n=1 Tax=Abrus precatorius TaxID=3816 RepID=A0A8B8LT30_ABRPR|nr:eukaryotic translation initiation factor 3 subunit G-like isoform X1 [Abrus precatorius]
MVMAHQGEPAKLRWGELEEDDGEDLDFLLPPRQVIGPDENGIKKVIEYKFDDDGNKVKITTTTRTRKLANARLSKRAVERRSWPKFGDAVHEDVGSRLTMVSTEEILLERPKPLGSPSLPFSIFLFEHRCLKILLSNCAKTEEPKTAGDPLAQFQKGAVLMVCRTCGKKGDHWTSRCPYKDLAPPSEGFVDKPAASDVVAATTGSTKAAYVPPGMRAGAERTGSDMRRRNDENSVRVTNLSEDTRESDLLELFRPFGPVSRVYVAIDQKTGMSRGFGFVNFVNREDAQRAISKLNGYGYDSLILRVEWATPRTN